jgi:hypothetical protein
MAGIEKWDRRRKETFTSTQSVLKNGEILVDFILSHEMHRELVNGNGEIIQGTVWTVSSSRKTLCLGWWQPSPNFIKVGVFIFGRRR